MDTKNRFASAETNDEINTNDHYLMRGGVKRLLYIRAYGNTLNLITLRYNQDLSVVRSLDGIQEL